MHLNQGKQTKDNERKVKIKKHGISQEKGKGRGVKDVQKKECNFSYVPSCQRVTSREQSWGRITRGTLWTVNRSYERLSCTNTHVLCVSPLVFARVASRSGSFVSRQEY